MYVCCHTNQANYLRSLHTRKSTAVLRTSKTWEAGKERVPSSLLVHNKHWCKSITFVNFEKATILVRSLM